MQLWASALAKLLAELISGWLSRLERDRQNREAGRADERERQAAAADKARADMDAVPVGRPDDVVDRMREKGLF